MEDVETLLPPMESKQPAQPQKQREMPTQTGELSVRKQQGEKSTRTEKEDMQEMFRLIMAKMDATKEELRKDIGETSKKMEESNQSLKEELGKKLDNINKEIREDRVKDVYKRQAQWRT